MKKVSVIIPFYNQTEFIHDAVESVLNSTYENIEIIVVNDGSDEVSPDVLREIIPQNIKIINQKNSGVCKARNIGIENAKGEYILPLDADDKIAPDYIEKAVKILDENSDIGIVYCDAEFFGDINEKLELKPSTIKNMLVQNRIFSSAIFRKSDFLKTMDYRDEMLIGCEDWDLWLSFIELGLKIYKIPKILFYYRKQCNMRTNKALKFSNYFLIRKNIIKFHEKLYKKYFWQIFFPILFLIIKNFGYNLIKNFRIKFLQIKKCLRRLYYKITIDKLNLYPEIKRIDKSKLQQEIENFYYLKRLFGTKRYMYYQTS